MLNIYFIIKVRIPDMLNYLQFVMLKYLYTLAILKGFFIENMIND